MKDFFIHNFKECIILITFVIEMILLMVSILKKGKKGTTLYTDIFSALPSIISRVEEYYGAGHGSEKLNMCIDILSDIFTKETGQLITKSEIKYFSDAIEKILSTPKKKDK
jgi:hypothetical protein